ncbi:MAG: MurT ligase domain-containing protein [Methanobacteriaceae archaeon]|nr:MurT ligase domain-containing protein [Methanobacteriaceae archaeon]
MNFSKFKHNLAIYSAKITLKLLNLTGRSGTALPGKVAVTIDPQILKEINKKCKKIIFVTGTNGKTTTNNLTYHILNEKDNNIISNLKGANMPSGIISAYIRNTKEKYDYGIFEIDEGSLREIITLLKPDYFIITNFFRDQLDRYGELELTVKEVYDSVKTSPDTNLILNIDDPYVNQFKKLTKNITTFSVDLNEESKKKFSEKHINTSLILKNCPECGGKLEYNHINYGHVGNYYCTICDNKKENADFTVTDVTPKNSKQELTIKHENKNYKINNPYPGLYNVYNVCGVFSLCNKLGIKNEKIIERTEDFKFALGRIEEMTYKGKKIVIILTKNPVGLSESVELISKDENSKIVVHILNDNSADGRDISWIWDGNTKYNNKETIEKYYCSGKRAEEIALKVNYDGIDQSKLIINDNIYKTLDVAIKEDVDVIYVLSTYTTIFITRDYLEKIVKT